jgi:hypothetical protein
MKTNRCFLILACLASLQTMSGCGYAFQSSKSPLTEKEGIRKVYVSSLVNDTYKAGVEITVYNALLRVLSVHRRIELVGRPEDADAELRGKVIVATYVAGASTPAISLVPILTQFGSGDQRSNILIATEYEASLGCTFTLVRRHPNLALKQKEILWSASFSRGEPFNASNQLGTQGDTSTLINESEFDRALSDLATAMMGDVHESMLAMF